MSHYQKPVEPWAGLPTKHAWQKCRGKNGKNINLPVCVIKYGVMPCSSKRRMQLQWSSTSKLNFNLLYCEREFTVQCHQTFQQFKWDKVPLLLKLGMKDMVPYIIGAWTSYDQDWMQWENFTKENFSFFVSFDNETLIHRDFWISEISDYTKILINRNSRCIKI